MTGPCLNKPTVIWQPTQFRDSVKAEFMLFSPERKWQTCWEWQLSVTVQHEEGPSPCKLLLEKRPQIQGRFLLYMFRKLGAICIRKDRQKAHREPSSLTTEGSPEVSKARSLSLWGPQALKPTGISCTQHSSLMTSMPLTPCQSWISVKTASLPRSECATSNAL